MEADGIILNGEIVLDGEIFDSAWCEMYGGGCFSARLLRDALARFTGDVTVRVNSPGGDPFEGEAARVAMLAHPGRVTVIVGGQASSAASLMIMGADRIEVSQGSIIMVHDPSSALFGNAADHRFEAQVLDTLSQTYAQVYAARTGQTAEAIRALMAAETWLGGEAAVAAGFADAIAATAPPPDMAPPELVAAQAMQASTRRRVMMSLNSQSAPTAARGGTLPTASAGHQQAEMAASQEVDMDPEEITAGATPDNDTVAAAPAQSATPSDTPRRSNGETHGLTMTADASRAAEERGVERERARVRDIRTMAQPFMASGQVTEAQLTSLIEEGVPAAQASTRLLTMLAAGSGEVSPPRREAARISRDENDTRAEGLIQAMMRNYDGPGEQFRGIRLRSLAMELGGRRGFNEHAQIREGMRSTTMMGGAHGVSDFAYITTEVMNRSLIAAYDRRGANWNIATGAPISAADFRELSPVRFGGDFTLKTVKEDGEYHEATLADEAEGLKVERRGRTIHLTFEAVVNDDMGAFNRIPGEFAMQARIMESSMVWALVRNNATLKSDGVALFASGHGNLAASGSALSVASIGAGRAAMWKQTAYGSKDAEDFLQIAPNMLWVPPALETVGMQFLAGITPAKATDVNPFTNSLTLHTVPNLGLPVANGSDTAWYLASSDLPPVSVAYLEGYEAPTVQTVSGMNPDRVSMAARHIFGAAATEFRGVYKNAGA